MTALEKAEQIVREHPVNKELMDIIRPAGDQSFFYLVEDNGDHWKGIWDGENEVVGIRKTTTCSHWKNKSNPHLEHYMMVLGNGISMNNGSEFNWRKNGEEEWIRFNLTTGKPATEKDAEEFIKLVENV